MHLNQRMNSNMRTDPDDQMNGDEQTHAEVEDLVDMEDFGQEYQLLDSTLDQLDAKLDDMEQKNDDLFEKFKDLLESSRQTRKELEEERLAGTASLGSALQCFTKEDDSTKDTCSNASSNSDVHKKESDKS